MFNLSLGFGSSGFQGSASFSRGGFSFNLSIGGSSRRFATGVGNAQYPQDLLGHRCIIFTAVNDRQNSRVGNQRVSEAGTSIALPLPGNLSTAYNAQYSNEGIGPLGKLAFDAGAGGFNNVGEFGQNMVDRLSSISSDERNAIMANLGSSLAEAEIGALAATAVGGGALGAATGAAVAQAFKGGMAGAGVARNPHLAALFTGTNFRTHSFQYKLVARNEAESQAIKAIIHGFKLHSAPNYLASGHFLQYPSKWEIVIKNGPGDYLFKIGDSVCTNVEVNYTAEGGAYFYDKSGAPVSVGLSLEMQEVAITTQKEIMEGH